MVNRPLIIDPKWYRAILSSLHYPKRIIIFPYNSLDCWKMMEILDNMYEYLSGFSLWRVGLFVTVCYIRNIAKRNNIF